MENKHVMKHGKSLQGQSPWAGLENTWQTTWYLHQKILKVTAGLNLIQAYTYHAGSCDSVSTAGATQ